MTFFNPPVCSNLQKKPSQHKYLERESMLSRSHLLDKKPPILLQRHCFDEFIYIDNLDSKFLFDQIIFNPIPFDFNFYVTCYYIQLERIVFLRMFIRLSVHLFVRVHS